MIFNVENYASIKSVCNKKAEIEFDAPLDLTAFNSSNVPNVWTPYPPAQMLPEEYARLLVYLGSDAKGTLTKLELLIYLNGGVILYKKNGSDYVSLKVIWPTSFGVYP